MSQRCALNWDSKCDLYLDSIDQPAVMKNFLRDAVSKKYCRLSKSSECKTVCQPFNPIVQESPTICGNVGKETLKDINGKIDIGWNVPINMSPDYMSKSCTETCDVVTPSDIKADDMIINACLKYGYCDDYLNNICLSNKDKTISHPGVTQFCGTDQKPRESFKTTSVSNREPTIQHEGKEDIIAYILLGVLCLVIMYAIFRRYNLYKRLVLAIKNANK